MVDSQQFLDDKEPSLLFAHKTIRPAQKELIADLQAALKEGKVLLAHAPTGLGKTASALSVMMPVAKARKKKVFFLTNRHTQHEIALETLKAINEQHNISLQAVNLVGKKQMCSQEVATLFGNEFSEYCKAVVEKSECEYYNRVYAKNSKALTVEARLALDSLKRKAVVSSSELKVLASDSTMCAYELALQRIKKADLIIADYNYIFHPYVRDSIFAKLELSLEDCMVIVDEAHNLPSRITSLLSSSLKLSTLKYAISEAKKFSYKGLVLWLEHLQTVLQDLARPLQQQNSFQRPERRQNATLSSFTQAAPKPVAKTFQTTELPIEKRTFMSKIENVVDYDKFIEQLEEAATEVRKAQKRSNLAGIAEFLEAWQGDDHGYSRVLSCSASDPQFITLSYNCLDPSFLSQQIFEEVHGAMLMSATLQPTFMYKDLLGISRAVLKEYPSPFPLENRRSIVLTTATTKYSMRSEAMYQKIAQICSDVARIAPGNVAFFFPSYYLRDKVVEHINSEKLQLLEQQQMSKEDKEQFLQRFKDAKDSGALLLAVSGANFAEGVDLPGDLLHAVVIIGVPLTKPTKHIEDTISYYDQKFSKGWDYAYLFPAMNRCIQSAGRCIRSATDRGAVIYLDERFAWKKYFDCLPREGLMVLRSQEQATNQLREFFAPSSQ